MNLYSFLNYGARLAPSDAQRRQTAIENAAEKARQQWLNALLVDETRAWMSMGEPDSELITAYTTMLTIAGLTAVYESQDADSADIRVIRGAISAATQCVRQGWVMTPDVARAMSSAASRARQIVETASTAAIVHAAEEIRKTVGIV